MCIYKDGNVKGPEKQKQKQKNQKKTINRIALNILLIFKDLIDFHILNILLIFLQNQSLFQDIKEKISKMIGTTHLNKVVFVLASL